LQSSNGLSRASRPRAVLRLCGPKPMRHCTIVDGIIALSVKDSTKHIGTLRAAKADEPLRRREGQDFSLGVRAPRQARRHLRRRTGPLQHPAGLPNPGRALRFRFASRLILAPAVEDRALRTMESGLA